MAKREELVKLRFVEMMLDGSGNPMPHATKQGQLARQGGQIPLYDEATGEPRSVFPGECFEVPKHIADDLRRARPGVIVLESEYQARKVKFEVQREIREEERLQLAASYRQQKKAKDARTRMAALAAQERAATLREELAQLDGQASAAPASGLPWKERRPAEPDLAAQLASIQAQLKAEAEQRTRDAARIQELEARLAAKAGLSEPPPAPPKSEEKLADPQPDKGPDHGKSGRRAAG